MDFLTNNLPIILGGGTGAFALWALKKIPNDKIKSFVNGVFYKLGVTMTLGLGKWKVTKKIWNATVEPYFIDLIDNTVNSALQGFVD